MEKIYMAATNTSNILSIDTVSSHGMQTSMASIEAESSTLNIGDAVSIDLGYVGDHNVVFNGYVRGISRDTPNNKYSITATDVLSRAMDYFIVSSTPDNPFTRSNISAEDLVEDVLNLAGITNYTADPTSFTFAINNPLEVSLTSAYDYCNFISSLLAWHLYADINGLVHFVDRKPYLTGGESTAASIYTTNAVSISYLKDAENLRNRVVVWGAEGITADVSESSPYLPSGFYKTAMVSAPTVIDSQSMADLSASYNLDLYNRLTERLQVSIVGDSSIFPRNAAYVDVDDSDMDGNWYLYGVSHSANNGGFTTDIELRK